MSYVLNLLLAGQPIMMPSAYSDRNECEMAGIDAIVELEGSRFICVENGTLPLGVGK